MNTAREILVSELEAGMQLAQGAGGKVKGLVQAVERSGKTVWQWQTLVAGRRINWTALPGQSVWVQG